MTEYSQPAAPADEPGRYPSVQPPHPRRPRWLVPTVAAAAAAIAITAGALLVIRATGAAPTGTPLIGEDSGVAACKAIAADNKMAGDNKDDTFTEAEYRQIRKQFADSGDQAIRDNGTKIIDLAWQMQSMDDDDGLAALPLIGELTSAYAGLTGGCAAHGITIPPLGSEGPEEK